MTHGRHGTMPSYALWTLVVIGDLALIVANAGVALLWTMAAVVTAGLCGLGASFARRARNARRKLAERMVMPVTPAGMPATTTSPPADSR